MRHRIPWTSQWAGCGAVWPDRRKIDFRKFEFVEEFPSELTNLAMFMTMVTPRPQSLRCRICRTTMPHYDAAHGADSSMCGIVVHQPGGNHDAAPIAWVRASYLSCCNFGTFSPGGLRVFQTNSREPRRGAVFDETFTIPARGGRSLAV